MTVVVNLRTSDYDIYIGRGSPYGNPFKIGKDGDRDEVIRKFRLYFQERLKDLVYKKRVMDLHNKRLGCYCVENPWIYIDGGHFVCHGQVIAEFIENAHKEN